MDMGGQDCKAINTDEKCPNSESSCFGNWCLMIGVYLVFEIWLLVIRVGDSLIRLSFNLERT